MCSDDVNPVSKFPQADALPQDAGESMMALIRRLYPINRSITGAGLRDTLAELGREVPLQIVEVPTGTEVFDWSVPKEWNIRGGYIEDQNGSRVVDFEDHNLHVVGYSVPVDRKMPLSELRPRLHTLPDKPDWIPYRTSYYSEDWGFCLSHNTLESLEDGEYRVRIDSDLTDGSLTYAECFIPGREEQEVLFFAHTCHPSLCNDNLSGISVAVALAQSLAQHETRFSYRFVFAPATIGSITWLASNQDKFDRVIGGLVLSVIGDDGPMVYKKSRIGGSIIDRAAEHVLTVESPDNRFEDFSPWGYDERQFCSPGINLPVGRLTRTPHGEFPEYHTSADDLSIVRADRLADSLSAVWSILHAIEHDETYQNLAPFGEPQLGRRGLYRKMGGYQDVAGHQLAMLWVLNQSDGGKSLLDIAILSGLPFALIHRAAMDLVDVSLIEPLADSGRQK